MFYYNDYYNYGNYYNYDNNSSYYQNKGYQMNENYSNYYNNNSNYKPSKKKPKIKLEEALSKSSYPKYTKDFIEEFLINNYSDKINAKVFLTEVKNEKLFVIEYKLQIDFSKKIYDVYILVYLPPLYPNYEPEFYISKRGKIGISNYYQIEKKIDPKDLRLNLYYFTPFIAERNNIEEIIDKIKQQFNKEFPMYKNNYENGYEKYSEKCYLDKNLSNEIIIEKKYNNKNNINKKYDINSINDDYIEENNNIKINNYDKNNNKINFSNNNKEFNDETFLEFIRNQTKDKVREKFMNFEERFKVEENNKELSKMNISVKTDLNNIKFNSTDINMKKEMEKLIALKEKLNNVEKQLIQANEAIKKNNKNKTIFEKCNELIKIKNEKDMEYVVMQKTIEDYLVFLKKGFEKKIVSFEDMLRQTRLLSREIFNIKYLRKKEKQLEREKYH